MARGSDAARAEASVTGDGRHDAPLPRFPWLGLTLVWLGLCALLMVRFWPDVAAAHYSDVDDLMRLMQVRDLLHGQSWFDMTQHRIDPPFGLPMHWSRLVDLPILAVIAPLAPLIGEARAEQVAVAIVPLITLGTAMIGLLAMVRRLLGPDPLLVLLAPFMLVTAPAVLMQMFPTRIDHHGWQIAMATLAVAALLDRRPLRSGLLAGAATAVLLSISLEGLPFAVATAGILALLWAANRESSVRLSAFMAALAVVEAICFVATAPTLRWTTPLCDAVKPAHVVAIIVSAAAIAIAVRATATRTLPWRLAALAICGAVGAAAFGSLAPDCIGSPFGTMDPLVHRFWYVNVVEGMPFYDQSFAGAASMLAFPIVGLAGAAIGWRRAGDAEMRRRWLLVLLIAAASFVVGAMVRRAAGFSHVVAIPGALVFVQLLRPRIEAIGARLPRVLATATMILVLSPLMPVWAAASIIPDTDSTELTPEAGCGVECGIDAIGRLPTATIFTEIDIGPRVIAATHHSVNVGPYHRLERPLHREIAAFIGSPVVARKAICDGRFAYLLIAPYSGETRIYRRAGPGGFLARLVRGEAPHWLTPMPLPTGQLRLYRIVHGPACHG
ncbi:MAG: hypothetical protein ACTHM8_00215 [Sphingomonas sp.]